METERSVLQRHLGGWRMVASAWAVAIALVVLFGGVQALASRHSVMATDPQLVGAVIPSHEMTCVGADVMAAVPAPAVCHTVSDDMARAEAEAEVGASYGW